MVGVGGTEVSVGTIVGDGSDVLVGIGVTEAGTSVFVGRRLVSEGCGGGTVL